MDFVRCYFERYADGTFAGMIVSTGWKQAFSHADRVSTRFPSYAHEIMTSQFGLRFGPDSSDGVR